MDLDAHVRLILDSYERLLGHPLMQENVAGSLTEALDRVDFALLSHGTEADPIFNYGNRFVLELFEMGWDQFTQTPSRLSAEPVHRDERAHLLERVTRDGYIDDYIGIRISATGRRFRIRDAVVWNLYDEAGNLHGQAAAFRDIQPLAEEP